MIVYKSVERDVRRYSTAREWAVRCVTPVRASHNGGTAGYCDSRMDLHRWRWGYASEDGGRKLELEGTLNTIVLPRDQVHARLH